MLHKATDGLMHFLFPALCCACGDSGMGRFDICLGCYRELPRLFNGCPRCAEPLIRPGLVCERCRQSPPAFDAVITPFRYAPPVNTLIHDLKFSGKLSSGRLLGEMLGRHLCRLGAFADCIVPAPLHHSRLRQRGFNQTMELAGPVQRALGIPLKPRLLHRVRRTAPQSELPKQERDANVRDAFAVRGRADNLTVAVIEDVVTTGNTARAMAQTLKQAGAARVEIWAIARAGHRAPE